MNPFFLNILSNAIELQLKNRKQKLLPEDFEKKIKDAKGGMINKKTVEMKIPE